MWRWIRGIAFWAFWLGVLPMGVYAQQKETSETSRIVCYWNPKTLRFVCPTTLPVVNTAVPTDEELGIRVKRRIAPRVTCFKSESDWTMVPCEEEKHRWASDIVKLTFTDDGSGARYDSHVGNPFPYLITDCTQDSPPAEPCMLTEKEKQAGVGCIGNAVKQPKCKVVVLDWCIDHGETRVLKNGKPQ